jgi:hypothetical protein
MLIFNPFRIEFWVGGDVDKEEDGEEAIMLDRVGGSEVEIVVVLGTGCCSGD